MTRYLNFFCLFAFYTCFAARDPPSVTIPEQGTIIGKEVSRNRVQKIIGYYGIPYAQPPINTLRFSPPVTDPLPAWEGTRNATEYAPSCIQTKKDLLKEASPFLQLITDEHSQLNISEDCLYLNVFTPFGKKMNFHQIALVLLYLFQH